MGRRPSICAVLIATPALATAGLSANRVPTCTAVVAGGDYNGGGGTTYAQVLVKNIGGVTCVVRGRPSLRLAAQSVPVSVARIETGPNAGTPSGKVVVRPGQTARAVVLVVPGSCDRSRSVTTAITARAGWRQRSVMVAGSVCRNGSGQVLVGGFA